MLRMTNESYNGIMFNIKEFCVKNEMRNKGMGTKIFTEFEKQLRNRGITEIVLFTSHNDKTEGFYQKRGQIVSHIKSRLYSNL